MRERIAKVMIMITIAVIALGGLAYALLEDTAVATTSFPGYDIVLEGEDAPLGGRPAPYGQYIVTHNSVNITTTEQFGTVARTAGYDGFKAIMCDVGAYDVTVDVLGRVTSTGDTYTITTGTVLPANTNTISNLTQIAPWMSLRLTSDVTGSTTTCGIFVQTP